MKYVLTDVCVFVIYWLLFVCILMSHAEVMYCQLFFVIDLSSINCGNLFVC